MLENYNVGENLNAILAKLENFFQTKTVIGEPIKIGEITLVPFIDITFGMGSGGNGNTGQKYHDNGTVGGAGSGGRISPSAVLVIQEGHVELLHIKQSKGLDKLIEIIPDIIEKTKEYKETSDTEEVRIEIHPN
ncbi:sporulation protein [Dehalobacter sp. DCM]|uniref:GerW family sporulation protein n=1 Tax=Dehalobacter sp. DCM TaxID=2907827 RepID=UPI003081F483|nr:sporulation protein [Dehalobacter sp. DCM]